MQNWASAEAPHIPFPRIEQGPSSVTKGEIGGHHTQLPMPTIVRRSLPGLQESVVVVPSPSASKTVTLPCARLAGDGLGFAWRRRKLGNESFFSAPQLKRGTLT